jgi:hypothetical protein
MRDDVEVLLERTITAGIDSFHNVVSLVESGERRVLNALL